MNDENPVSSKILEIMNTKGTKDSLVSILSKDKDLRKMFYWYTGWIIVLSVSLFINLYVSLAIGILLISNALMMLSLVTGKLTSIFNVLTKIKEESEVISYNKSLTDAINLLFHNNYDLREKGKDIILRDYPEHSQIILSAERIMVDSEDDCSDITYDFRPKVITRIN